MKKVIYLFMLYTSLVSQSNPYEGVYEYKSNNFFYEHIELKKDFRFKYNYRFHFINYSLSGNYRIKGDSLFLDSSPQKDKIIVTEGQKGNKNNIEFCIKDKLGNPFNYTLHVINKNNDTVTLLNQWGKSKIKKIKIKSFYIVDSKGLKTPLYVIKGKRTNYFNVLMETIRVFDNEVWQITAAGIKPKGMNGENQLYKLSKLK